MESSQLNPMTPVLAQMTYVTDRLCILMISNVLEMGVSVNLTEIITAHS